MLISTTLPVWKPRVLSTPEMIGSSVMVNICSDLYRKISLNSNTHHSMISLSKPQAPFVAFGDTLFCLYGINKLWKTPEPVILRKHLVACQRMFDLPHYEFIWILLENTQARLRAKVNSFTAVNCTRETIRVLECSTTGSLARLGGAVRWTKLYECASSVHC